MFASTPNSSTIDFEVLRVGETDVEVECHFTPSPNQPSGPSCGPASGAHLPSLLWACCSSVVVEARAYDMDSITEQSIPRLEHQSPSSSTLAMATWTHAGVTCTARAAAGARPPSESSTTSGAPEAFTIRIVGLRPTSTYVVVLAAYPSDAYDSGVDARELCRRSCWLPLRTLALPTYVRCMDRTDSSLRLSVTRPDNQLALHRHIMQMLADATGPYATATPSPTARLRQRGLMAQFGAQFVQNRFLMAPQSRGELISQTQEQRDTAYGALCDTILTTPIGTAPLWCNVTMIQALTRGAPTMSQVYFFRCRALRLRPPGLAGYLSGGFGDDEDVSTKVMEELIPAGDVTVTFSTLAPEAMYQVSVTGVERCVPSAQHDQRTSFSAFAAGGVGASAAFVTPARQHHSTAPDCSVGPVARRQSLSVITAATPSIVVGDGDDHDDALRVAPSSSRQPFLVYGMQSSFQYVHTLPRVVALVERVTPTSAAVSVSRQIAADGEVPMILGTFSATQRLALLAVGGADEPVIVIARLAKRRMTNMMSMRRGGSAGSRTSRSHSVTGGNTGRKGSAASTTQSVDFGATMQSAASYGSDDSGSDLESSDDDDAEDSDPDDVLDQSASTSQTGAASVKGGSVAGSGSVSGVHHKGGGHAGAPEEDNRRETGDIMIRGLATPGAPFMIDGLVSNNAYSIHYYTYELSTEERAEWQRQKDAAALAEANTADELDEEGSDDHQQLCHDGSGSDTSLPPPATATPNSGSTKKSAAPEDDGLINALRSTFRVDPHRYIGRSLIITPSPQRPLSIAQLGLGSAAANRTRRSSSVGSRNSTILKSAASSQHLIATGGLDGDDGYVQNDVCYEYKPSHKGDTKGGGAATYRYRSSVGGSTAGSPGALSPIASPKRRNLSVPQPRGGVSANGSPSPEALHPAAGERSQLLDWEDVAKDEALTTVVRHVFRDMNPCLGISLRSVTESGAEVCFSTDFKRTSDRVLARRLQQHAEHGDAAAAGDNGILGIPDYLLEQLTRQEMMTRASAIRRTMKFVFCVRILVLPRGEFSTDATSFASAESTLPMPTVSWDDLEALCRRPSHRLEREHTIRFMAKYNTHGQQRRDDRGIHGGLSSPVEDLEVDPWSGLHDSSAAGSPKAGTISRMGSMALSQNALHLLHQTQSEMSGVDKVKAALFEVVRGDSPDPLSPSPRAGDSKQTFSPKSSKGGKHAGGGAFPNAVDSTPHKGGKQSLTAAPAQQQRAAAAVPHLIEATVREYVFVCGHSKARLPPLPPDTRYLVSMCGVYAPDRPENFDEMKAAHEAAVERRETRRAERAAAQQAAAAEQEDAKAATTAASTAITPGTSVPQTPSASPEVARGSANKKSPAIMDTSVIVPDIDAFTVDSNDSLRTPSRSGTLTDRDDDDDGGGQPSIFGPALLWRQWTAPAVFMTNYVVRELKVLYVHSEGFRFDVNPMLSELEVNNCGMNDHAALAHVMGAHAQQGMQKYISAELSCLDDARYSRTVLLERDPTTACYEFIHSLKFDGRYQLRVRVGELPPSAAALRQSAAAATSGKAKKSRGPSAAVSPQETDVGSEQHTTDGAKEGNTAPAAQDEDAQNELEGFLKFGPTGPTTDFVMCFGNVVDVEEMERGLRCFLHPPYAGGHKTEYSVRARKNKLTSEAVMGSHLTDLASRDAFVLSRQDGDVNVDPVFLPPPAGTNEATPAASIRVLQVCSYLMVGCGSTGLYTSYPVLAKELGLNVALLRSLRPDSYNVSVRYLIVLSEALPSWRFGGRIQQNTHRSRSRSATFEQPATQTARVPRGVPPSTTIDTGDEPVDADGEASARAPAEARATATTATDLVHQDGAVVLLGRRHTVATTGNKSPAPIRFSAVASRGDGSEGVDGFAAGAGRAAGGSRNAAAALVTSNTPRVVTALHASLRASTRYTIGSGTVYRRHEVLPLRVGEHFATLCAVVSSYALFDLSILETPQHKVSSNLPSPVAGGDPLATFLTASQQFTLRPAYRFCDDASAVTAEQFPGGPAAKGDDDDDALSSGSHDLPINRTPNHKPISHNPEQQLYYDETNGTGELLLGMHECPANEFAEPVFSRRGKPLRYPSLTPDANISNMTVLQEQRMSKFLNEVNEDMDRLAFHESAFGGTATNAATGGATGGGAASSTGGPAPLSIEGQSGAAGQATAALTVTPPAALGGGGQSIAELAQQILKRGDLSPMFQLLRREISGVQVELTLASDASTRQAKVQTYTPQMASTITLNNLLPATEYRVRIRVQGRYNSSIGSSPNWSRWSLPIRFTTQEKLIIQSTFATESAIMLRWVRERSLAETEDILSATSASASTFGGSMMGTNDKKHGHHRAPMMDVRISAGIVDQRKYQLPVAPPPGLALASNSSAGDPGLTTPPPPPLPAPIGGGATTGGKKKETASFLTSIFTNVLPFEVEISLLDNNDSSGTSAASKKRRPPPSPGDHAAVSSSRRAEPTVLQQCRVWIPPFLGGLRLKDCFPGMKYSLRVRTTTSRECDAALDGTSTQQGDVSSAGSTVGSLRRRRSSISRPGGAREDERNVGNGLYSPRVLISTLSDVMVTLLRLGAAYCTFRIDKLAADMSALKKHSAVEGKGVKGQATPKHGNKKLLTPTLAAISDPDDDADDDTSAGGTADDAHHQLLAKMSHYEVRCRPAGGWVSEFEHKQLMKEKLQLLQQQQQLEQQQKHSAVKKPLRLKKIDGANGDDEDERVGSDDEANQTKSPLEPHIATRKAGSASPAPEDIDESLAVGLEQYASLLIQWRRPTFQGLDAAHDVGISANAGAIHDSNAEREVTLDALLPGTMYVLSIRPFIVGQFAGQWVEMVRFSTPSAPKPKLIALCEDQMLFQWKEPQLRRAMLLNQDSARALRAMALHNEGADTNSVTSGHDDTSSLAESMSMASSVADENNVADEGLPHGPIPFTVTAVEIQIKGRFCDPAARRFGTHLKDLYDATPEVTLTKLLPITTRVRERLTAVYRQQQKAGGAAAIALRKKAAARKKKLAARQRLASAALDDSSSYLRALDHDASSWAEDSDDDALGGAFAAPFRIFEDDDVDKAPSEFDDDAAGRVTPSMSESSASATSPTTKSKQQTTTSAPSGPPDSPRHGHHHRHHTAAEVLPQIGLELLLENAFPDATYHFTIRFCDQHQVWSPASEPWVVVTQPTVDALVLGSGESYAVVRTQRAPRSAWSTVALQMLRDYNLFAHDWRIILDKCRESLKSRLMLIARYGEDLASGMDSNMERSFGDDDFLSKDQLLEELDLLNFEHERLQRGVEGAPVAICSGVVANTMRKDFEYLHRDLISRRARRFRFATLDLVSTLSGSVSGATAGDAALRRALPDASARARGVAESVTEAFTASKLLGSFARDPSNGCATATLQAILGVLENPAVFDDARLYDPNRYTVELSVVERSRIDNIATRPSRQYLFGRATLVATLSSHTGGDATLEGDNIAALPPQQDVVVKRESCDLISVCHLRSGTQYVLVTRVNAGHTAPPPASTAYAAYNNAQQETKNNTSTASGAGGGSSSEGGGGTADDDTADEVVHLFSERKRCASFFDPALQVTAFTSGMWSDALPMETLPNILVHCRAVGFSEVLFEVYRPLTPNEGIPDDEAYEEMRSHNRFLALGNRSALGAGASENGGASQAANLTSNSYQLSINGKHTPYRDMQRFFKGEKKLVHLYKLPPDSAVVVACRSRFSLDEFLRDAENSMAAMASSTMMGASSFAGTNDGSPSIGSSAGGRRTSMSSSQQQSSVRSWLRPETLARRKEIVFWSNWMPLLQDVRTIPPRPSIPVLYEARSMPPSAFRYEGRVPPPEASWEEYMSFWWSVHVDQVNHYPKEIQLDQDMEKYESRRVGRSGSHTTVETTRQSMPLTFLSHQAKLAQVLFDRQDDEQVQLQDDMLMLSTKFHGDEVVSIADPRGLYVHAEPLLRPSENIGQQHSNNASETAADGSGGAQQQQPAFTGLAFEGPPSTYSYEVEIAEFSPEMSCFSQFFPVGRTQSAFMRLKLPRHEDHNLRGALPSSSRCLIRLRSRVEALDAPGGCVRSMWSPIVSWRPPVQPPEVSDFKVALHDDAPKMFITFSYPTSMFHNQLVYEILMRESDTPFVPDPNTTSGVVQTVTPVLISPVVLGPLRTNRYYHTCVRAVTSFGRSAWSRWHSLKLEGKLASNRGRPSRSTTQRRHELQDDEHALAAYHAEMTGSDWDQENAWCYPFPQSRVMDGFPCPIDSALHFTTDVAVRQARRAEVAAGGGGGCPAPRVESFPAFVAAGHLRDVRNQVSGGEDVWQLEGDDGSSTAGGVGQLAGSRSPASSDHQLAVHLSPSTSSPLVVPAVPEIFAAFVFGGAGGGPVSPLASAAATTLDASPTHYSPGEGRRKTKVTLVATPVDATDPLLGRSLDEQPRLSPFTGPTLTPLTSTARPPLTTLPPVLPLPPITNAPAPQDDAANLSLNSSVSDLDATAKPPAAIQLAAATKGQVPSMLLTILPQASGSTFSAETPSPSAGGGDPARPRTMQQFMREFLPSPLSPERQERLLEQHRQDEMHMLLEPVLPSAAKPTRTSAGGAAPPRRRSTASGPTTSASTVSLPSRRASEMYVSPPSSGHRPSPAVHSRRTATPPTAASAHAAITPADRIFGVAEDPLAALRFANHSIVVRPPQRSTSGSRGTNAGKSHGRSR